MGAGATDTSLLTAHGAALHPCPWLWRWPCPTHGVGSALGASSSTDGHGAAAATVPGTHSGHLPAVVPGARRSDGYPERWCVISEVFEIRDLPRLPCRAASRGPSAAQRASSQPGTPGSPGTPGTPASLPRWLGAPRRLSPCSGGVPGSYYQPNKSPHSSRPVPETLGSLVRQVKASLRSPRALSAHNAPARPRQKVFFQMLSVPQAALLSSDDLATEACALVTGGRRHCLSAGLLSGWQLACSFQVPAPAAGAPSSV